MLADLLRCVQSDPGGRGLARDPVDNLLNATVGQFERAVTTLNTATGVQIVTGFYIPNGLPPTFETDGPLGALFLAEALAQRGIPVSIRAEQPVVTAIRAIDDRYGVSLPFLSHVVFLERGGPAADGRRRTMRGLDITDFFDSSIEIVPPGAVTIGIGDGGNEIGMGSIAHETIIKNIPRGDLVHCRTAVDHLIVAGVSNWGAYALAAGLDCHLQCFDPGRELARLEKMVAAGPLVDGVTGRCEATVDGLSWDEYAKPLVEIRDILGR
jgi:hypothetical protein